MTGDFKKLDINPEEKKRIKFNFTDLNETTEILNRIQEQQNLLISLKKF